MPKAVSAHVAGVVTGAMLLSACSLAPDYHRPTTAVPAAYKEVPTGWTSAAPAADAAPQKWWEAFNDPVLSNLEERIEGANPSLAAAVARFDEARGALREASADFYPQVGVAGSAEREHSAKNAPSPTSGATFNDYKVGASASWEIDLFGRIRNSVRAGKADVEASAADVAGARLGLQAQLATAYFNLRGLDAR
jgi:outer membrane protein, multidrug efflux system